jgi:hypothetical protein
LLGRFEKILFGINRFAVAGFFLAMGCLVELHSDLRLGLSVFLNRQVKVELEQVGHLLSKPI